MTEEGPHAQRSSYTDLERKHAKLERPYWSLLPSAWALSSRKVRKACWLHSGCVSSFLRTCARSSGKKPVFGIPGAVSHPGAMCGAEVCGESVRAVRLTLMRGTRARGPIEFALISPRQSGIIGSSCNPTSASDRTGQAGFVEGTVSESSGSLLECHFASASFRSLASAFSPSGLDFWKIRNLRAVVELVAPVSISVASKCSTSVG